MATKVTDVSFDNTEDAGSASMSGLCGDVTIERRSKDGDDAFSITVSQDTAWDLMNALSLLLNANQ
jgi:hypothetical protein